ncbi:MAG: IS1595 family transposase [Phycisphaerales bacterium]
MVAANKTPNTLMGTIRYFDPETTRAFVHSIKWPEGPCCPECGSVNVGYIKSRDRHQCREKGCRKQFSLTTGTIMEATHLRLDQWVVAVWMIVNCRNGVSSCEIARTIGCKQQSAWHLLHRVRHILAQAPEGKLTGTIEADSTWVGGVVKYMPKRRRVAFLNKGPSFGKATVHAIRDRATGTVRAQVIEKETRAATEQVIGENVAHGSRVFTDGSSVYSWLGAAGYSHESVNHTAGEYARGEVYTNGCENYFNCLRRAFKGTYIKPTPGHLQLYVDEATFRFNVRDLTEWERFERAMREIVGKRLTYSDLTGGATR